MLQELIYTSSPQGLKPGSQGFCTVACTAGMPPNLTRFLETLSGYRHVYLPPDPNTVKNPVAFSSLIVRQGGLTWRILSRTADAGLDYTKRTNKISHHLVLDNAELQPSGPAAILLQYSQFCTSWNQKAALLPANKKLPTFSSPIRVCNVWKQFTGDAGWGGVLAEAAVVKRPVSLIFHPGVPTLPLIEESLALLPPEQQWKTTFTTYYCNIPTGVDCQIKSILIGSPEIAQARLSANTLVLDLTQPLAAPPAGKWTELARTGVSPEQERAIVMPVQTPIKASAENESGAYELADSPVFQSVPATVSVPGQKKKIYTRGSYDFNRYESEEASGKKGCLIGIIIFFAVIVLIPLGVILCGRLSNWSKRTQEIQKQSQPQTTTQSEEKKTEPPKNEPLKTENALAREQSNKEQNKSNNELSSKEEKSESSSKTPNNDVNDANEKKDKENKPEPPQPPNEKTQITEEEELLSSVNSISKPKYDSTNHRFDVSVPKPIIKLEKDENLLKSPDQFKVFANEEGGGHVEKDKVAKWITKMNIDFRKINYDNEKFDFVIERKKVIPNDNEPSNRMSYELKIKLDDKSISESVLLFDVVIKNERIFIDNVQPDEWEKIRLAMFQKVSEQDKLKGQGVFRDYPEIQNILADPKILEKALEEISKNQNDVCKNFIAFNDAYQAYRKNPKLTFDFDLYVQTAETKVIILTTK